MFSLENSPYLLDNETEKQLKIRIEKIEERVELLRTVGTLNSQTIMSYYGQKRFEQVAESNAIEGSTLSVGETELAVMKGITITGHDPGYVRDAVSLDRALTRVSDLARDPSNPTDISQLQEIHALILGDRPGGGAFRTERVNIRGADHIPPRTWKEIMDQMEQWQSWSALNKELPAPLRSTVLHAWLTHIHPYIDGNGRVSRAIGNLELIRAGYPPIIIRKKERDQYIEALAESDSAGNLRSFIELIFDRVEGALTGLEASAKKFQGYSPDLIRIQKLQEQQLHIWSTSVKLLASIIEYHLTNYLSNVGGSCRIKIYDVIVDIDEFVQMCAGVKVAGAWAFIIRIDIPSLPAFEKLAYVGNRTVRVSSRLGGERGPSLFWSDKNPAGFPKWYPSGANSPYAVEFTSKLGGGDQWIVRLADDAFDELQTSDLAHKIADALMGQLGS